MSKLEELKNILNLHLLDWQKSEVMELLEEALEEIQTKSFENGCYVGQIAGFYEGKEDS
jgi:hypothetical protein